MPFLTKDRGPVVWSVLVNEHNTDRLAREIMAFAQARRETPLSSIGVSCSRTKKFNLGHFFISITAMKPGEEALMLPTQHCLCINLLDSAEVIMCESLKWNLVFHCQLRFF